MQSYVTFFAVAETELISITLFVLTTTLLYGALSS